MPPKEVEAESDEQGCTRIDRSRCTGISMLQIVGDKRCWKRDKGSEKQKDPVVKQERPINSLNETEQVVGG